MKARYFIWNSSSIFRSSYSLTTTKSLHWPNLRITRKAPNCLPRHTPHLSSSRHFATTNKVYKTFTMVNTTEKLEKLRKLMKERNIDVYVVPSEDSHQSEYLAPCDARRAYISGFTGSAGCAVITNDKAALQTDGRYFNQATKELDENWELLKYGLPDVLTWQEWVCEEAQQGKIVGVDATLLTASEAKSLTKKIKDSGAKDLLGSTENLVDLVWGDDKPARPCEPVMVLDTRYCGKDYVEKIKDVQKVLEKKKAVGLIISGLDEIMWLYNIRGNDIPFNPVAFCYALVTTEEASLFIDSNQVTEDVERHLSKHVSIKPYDSIFSSLTSLSQSISTTEKRKFMLANNSSWALAQALGEDKVDIVKSPITAAKAVKNETEMEGMRQCHIRDGAALTEYFAWLEDKLHSGENLDEVQAADKLEELRSVKENFVGLSFPTISSTGPNAATIHYKPEKGSCSTLDPKAIYLCDSGAQYFDGTTDTTRTLHFGEPSEMERKAYTLVLKGNIALSVAVFPKGTTGLALDTLARQFLWAEGLDFRHGTGHGVGSFLNVHEGPIGIGTRIQYSEVALAVGNVVSNEPGYYEDDNFGIRIENIIMVKEVKTSHNFGDKPYFGFEQATMVPMCRRLIDEKLLTDKEKSWLNDYHKDVWEKTHGFFEKDEKTLKWLKRETEAI